MPVNVVLVSTYELGHQPFGLASPAAWLRARGAAVTCLDLSREALRPDVIRDADLIAFYVPMHTATRLAAQLVAPIRELNPRSIRAQRTCETRQCFTDVDRFIARANRSSMRVQQPATHDSNGPPCNGPYARRDPPEPLAPAEARSSRLDFAKNRYR